MHKKTVLKNGIRLVTEHFENVRSVSIGIWVLAGSAYETQNNNGISHFIEHMFFKGTPSLTAKQIAEGIDYLGGHINASTGKEYTNYYVKVLDEHLEPALKILADLFCNSKLAKADVDLERNVIDEEILMSEDTPEDLVHDLIVANIYRDGGFGLPILGTTDTLKKIDANAMRKYIADNYSNSNIVISVAGSFDEDGIVSLMEAYFGDRVVEGSRELGFSESVFDGSVLLRKKETEQAHLCIAFPCFEYDHPLAYATLLMNTVLGGGMSSRLFQKIREEKGLVYSIFSYPMTNVHSGMFTIYAGMNPANLDTVIALISEELKVLLRDGVPMDLIAKTKNQIKGNIILGMETPSRRMSANASSEILKGEIQTQDELIAKINAIDANQVRAAIAYIFGAGKVSGAAIGPIDAVDLKGFC